MLQAMWGAELDRIRYRGRDSDVFQRLGAMGKPHLCDSPQQRALLRQLWSAFEAEGPASEVYHFKEAPAVAFGCLGRQTGT